MPSCSRMLNWYTRLQVLLVIRTYRELFLTWNWVRQSGGRHRSLCSIWCPLYGAQNSSVIGHCAAVDVVRSTARSPALTWDPRNEYCGEGDVVGRYAVMHPCAGSVFCWASCRKSAKSLARRLEGQSPMIGGCLYSPPVPRRRFWQSCTFPGLEAISPKQRS